MHNHNEKNNKSMMWMMIPCLLLIAVILFGGNSLVSSKYLWLIIVGVCIVPHIWMMLKGHRRHNNANTENKINNATKLPETKDESNKHKHGGCCH